MKTLLVVQLAIAACAFGGPKATVAGGHINPTAVPTYPSAPEAPASPDLPRPKAFVPKDPWRFINGHTNFAKGAAWKHFMGTVVQMGPTSVLVYGVYGDPGAVGWTGPGYGSGIPPAVLEEWTFIVFHFPYRFADGETLPMRLNLVAMEAGTYTYAAVTGGSRTVRALDYGQVVGPPPPPTLSPEQAAAIAEKQTKAKKEAEANALKYFQDRADKGDAYSQYRMGEYYLKGDGVEKDLTKAREMFQKAAAQGNSDAAAALAKLPPQTATAEHPSQP